jgi:hypothetical protein
MTLRPRAAALRRSAARARRALADMLTLKHTEGNEEARVKGAGYALIELWPPGGSGGRTRPRPRAGQTLKVHFLRFLVALRPPCRGLAPHCGRAAPRSGAHRVTLILALSKKPKKNKERSTLVTKPP